MFYTAPNQKTIIINRDMPKTNFLQISNEHWMDFNKKYGPYALQLYLYLAKNRNQFSLALSPQAAENEAGIKKTSFHKYFNLLVAEGFLVKQSGNIYNFYETPYHKGEIKTSGSPHDGQSILQDEQVNLSHEQCSSSNEISSSQDDIEINKDNINSYTDNGTNKQKQESERNRSTGNTGETFSF